MTTDIHRFDDKARLVMTLATDSADEMGSNEVSTGHLLVALADERSGTSAQVLKDLGFDANGAASRMRPAETTDEPISASRMGLSPAVQQVIELASSKARAEHSLTINSEHLLLALSEIEKGPGFVLLREAGISRHQIRQNVQAITGKSRAGAQRGIRPTSSKSSSAGYSTRSSSRSLGMHSDLIYPRIARKGVGPSIFWTVVIAVLGYILTAAFVERWVPRLGGTPGIETVVLASQMLGWLAAFLIPPIAAVMSAQITMQDVEQGGPELLRLANAPHRDILWGYVRGLLYRLRMLFALQVIASPLFFSGAVSALQSLQAALNVPGGVNPVRFVPALPDFEVVTLLAIAAAFTWLGIACGVSFAFRMKEAIMVGSLAALITIIGMLATVGLLLGSMLSPGGYRIAGVVRVLSPILVVILGLLIIRWTDTSLSRS